MGHIKVFYRHINKVSNIILARGVNTSTQCDIGEKIFLLFSIILFLTETYIKIIWLISFSLHIFLAAIEDIQLNFPWHMCICSIIVLSISLSVMLKGINRILCFCVFYLFLFFVITTEHLLYNSICLFFHSIFIFVLLYLWMSTSLFTTVFCALVWMLSSLFSISYPVGLSIISLKVLSTNLVS